MLSKSSTISTSIHFIKSVWGQCAAGEGIGPIGSSGRAGGDVGEVRCVFSVRRRVLVNNGDRVGGRVIPITALLARQVHHRLDGHDTTAGAVEIASIGREVKEHRVLVTVGAVSAVTRNVVVTKALDRRRADAELLNKRGPVYARLGRYDLALNDYSESIRRNANHPAALNNLAWLLATCPNEQVRNGSKAVAHAIRACEMSQWKETGSLDTLAAAHAEAGDFAAAIRRQSEAIELAPAQARTELQLRLDLYQAGKPYRQAVRAEGESANESPSPTP